jgi:hypothetical protein
MTISSKTLTDVIVAIITTVGVAGAFSLALFAVGSYFERAKARAERATAPVHTESNREFVLR